MVNASSGLQNPTLSFADRDYFKALKSDPQLPLYVSAPVRGRLGGDWKSHRRPQIQCAEWRMVGSDRRGNQSSAFSRTIFDRSLLGEHSMVALQRDDGVMLARHPHIDAIIGRSFGGAIGALGIIASAELARLAGKDGRQRAYSGRAPPEPLSTRCDRRLWTAAFVLDTWRKEARALIGLGSCCSLDDRLPGFHHHATDCCKANRQFQKKFDEQEMQLNTAFRHMSQGLVMFNSAAQLVICNDRYREIYDLPPDLTKPGCAVARSNQMPRGERNPSRLPRILCP